MIEPLSYRYATVCANVFKIDVLNVLTINNMDVGICTEFIHGILSLVILYLLKKQK